MAPTYETNDEARAPLVVNLKKELVRSPAELVELAVIAFRPLKSDPYVYIYEDETDFVILMLYVNDVLFLSAINTLLNKLKKQLMDWFEISGMDDVSRILGMNVTRDSENVPSTSARKPTRRMWYSATV